MRKLNKDKKFFSKFLTLALTINLKKNPNKTAGANLCSTEFSNIRLIFVQNFSVKKREKKVKRKKEKKAKIKKSEDKR